MMKTRVIPILALLLASCTKGSGDKLTDAGKSAGLSLAEKGRALVVSKNCLSCHSVDGSRLVGPSFKGIYNTEIKVVGGSTVKADDQYLRESIESPMAKIVDGYSPTMPVYLGALTEDEILSIIEYIKSLK